MKKNGQVLLILLLVMTVGLSVGLSVIQRSLSDVTTANKVEQSVRAFSAAEAGIERALRNDFTGANFTDNNSTATVSGVDLLPTVGVALEYPPIGKEGIAHFWLVDPATLGAPTYGGSSVDVYWGSTTQTVGFEPAIEVTVVYQNAGAYSSKKFFYDQQATTRGNGFTIPSQISPAGIPTTSGASRLFYAKQNISFATTPNPILIRARILYSNTPQPIALNPVGSGTSLPPQARLIKSTGTSGSVIRTVQVFTEDKVVPFFLDYAIFSAADINK